MTSATIRVYLFKGFERFWHWMQALLIFLLAITGFEVHGTYHILGFQKAVMIHNTLAWALIALIAFAIFWHLTTGEWRQYIPTTDHLTAVAHYYGVGIFKNEKHPFKESEVSKLNPLQRITYLGFKILIIPVQVTTGLLYRYYNHWHDWGISARIDLTALLHTAGAFALISFFIVHVYMTTTGRTPLAHVKAMITGWEEIETD